MKTGSRNGRGLGSEKGNERGGKSRRRKKSKNRLSPERWVWARHRSSVRGWVLVNASAHPVTKSCTRASRSRASPYRFAIRFPRQCQSRQSSRARATLHQRACRRSGPTASVRRRNRTPPQVGASSPCRRFAPHVLRNKTLSQPQIRGRGGWVGNAPRSGVMRPTIGSTSRQHRVWHG